MPPVDKSVTASAKRRRRQRLVGTSRGRKAPAKAKQIRNSAEQSPAAAASYVRKAGQRLQHATRMAFSFAAEPVYSHKIKKTARDISRGPSLSFLSLARAARQASPVACAFCSRLRLWRRRLTRHSQPTMTSTAMPAKPSSTCGALKP